MRLGAVSRSQRSWRASLDLTALAVCVLSVSCSLTTPLPPDAQPFQPPAIYARWWRMTEACSGHSGDFGAVHWYRTPGSAVLLHGKPAGAYWGSQGNRIILPEEEIDNGGGVRHEMLHALLQLRVDSHPRAEFLESCASVVDCRSTCATDGGPWHAPEPNYVVLPPDSLEVDSEAALLGPEADGQRWVALRIRVRNPRGQSVMIPAPDAAITQRAFRYDVRGPTGTTGMEEIAGDSSKMFFRPYETKSRLFEFRVASEPMQFHVPPGVQIFRGGYSWRWATNDTVVVVP